MADTIYASHIRQGGLLERHQLVWITVGAWENWVRCHIDLANDYVVANWAHRGLPFIARTSAFSDWQPRITLGLPLPPSLGRRRLSIDVHTACFLRTDAPPLLSDAISVGPGAWQATLTRLATSHADVRCFGSLAWQYVTGIDYLTAASDVDLLWPIKSAWEADAIVGAIADIAKNAPMRIDGELVAASGNAVQWSEWHSGASEVLVKSRTGASMKLRDEVFQ